MFVFCFAERCNVARAIAPDQQLLWEAMRTAVDEEMERDANVCVMGERSKHFHSTISVKARTRTLLIHVAF